MSQVLIHPDERAALQLPISQSFDGPLSRLKDVCAARGVALEPLTSFVEDPSLFGLASPGFPWAGRDSHHTLTDAL